MAKIGVRTILAKVKTRSHYAVYGFAALAVLGPMLGAGYILTFDMVPTPHVRLPEEMGSSYLFYAVLHYLNVLVPADILQKIVLFWALFLAGAGMHRLMQSLLSRIHLERESLGLYSSGLLYMINPFTYDRFMAGQFAVLLGYALLPWGMRALLQFTQRPGVPAALKLSGIALAISIVSIHTLGLLAVVGASVLAWALWQYVTAARAPADTEARGAANVGLWFRRMLLYGSMAIALFVAASSYWLIPLVAGDSSAARTIRQFDSADAHAFAAGGSTLLAKIGNVLQLQGFWMERHELFRLPQDQLPGWGTVRALLGILVVLGAVFLWRRGRGMAGMIFAFSGAGVLLSIGVGQPFLTAIGYREPHKFVGLVALGLTLLAGFGTVRLLNIINRRFPHWHTVAATGILITILIFTPTMYWGFAGQLSPRHYPDDWFALNNRLNAEKGNFKTIFLPWHQYMSFDFSDRIIANPAKNFFDKPIVVSNNPELENIPQPQNDPLVASIDAILKRAAERHDLGAQLARHDVRYLILAKEFDWRLYGYLDQQHDLVLAWETPHLRLYRNTFAKGAA